MKKVEIFTDGSCLGNPGRGAYAAILRFGDYEREVSAGYELTTNNRMEIMAAIFALESLKEACEVDLYTDSQYLKNAVESWIFAWQKNNWLTSAKKPVKNVDLWKRLQPQLIKHKINFHWLRGHSGHPENERCDELARQSASAPTLLQDSNYKPDNKRDA